ncbi:hypothetical protein M413DRAFT_27764 [Hebeloma cylindrosporum]|uniref:Uncharacterized protein n=1 Tax=Hebeloma cylindrosporum TaxID=76867 RepID=A0A0C3CCS0_HEBCY|nr:hypothetical protein M413DRAFT_27764 [Hebeloma cylindrosporum h7]
MPADRQKENKNVRPNPLRIVRRRPGYIGSDLLRAIQVSNDEPPEAEMPAIKQTQELLATNLAFLDASILTAQQTLEQLKITRSLHQSAYNVCRSASSIVRRVPVDVWREIFLFRHPPQQRVVMSFSQAPLVLTHVCRSWRYIANSTPELWTRLYIPPLLVYTDPIWSQPPGTIDRIPFLQRIPVIIYERVALLEAVLKRSGNRPLSISIAKSRMYEFLEFHAVLGIPPGSQYQKDLIFQIFMAMSRVYEILEPHIPRVEEAYISRCTIDNLSETDAQNILSSPRLRILRIHTLSRMQSFPDFIPDNWTDLTLISIRNPISVSWAKALFRKCTKLVECSLSLQSSLRDNVHLVETSPISLPALKVLSITEAKPVGRLLYPCLVVPNIQTLNCFETHPYANPYDLSVMTMLPKLHGLRSLQINPAVFTNDSFFNVVRCLPSLSHLILGSATQTSACQWLPAISPLDVLATRFHPTPGTTDTVFVLPNLQHIEVHHAPISDSDLCRFIDGMLCPGCGFHPPLRPGVVRLRSLTAFFRRIRQMDTFTRGMDYARTAGVAFTLKLYYSPANFYAPLSTQHGAAAVPTAA